MSKKVLSILLVLSLLLINASAALAKENSTVEEQAKKVVTSIAQGDDNMVGGGVPFDEPTTEDGVIIRPKWASGGINHTHQYIVANGLKILENDKGSDISQYYYADGLSNTLLEYTDKPDVDEIDLGTFCGHFYDPDTGKNFLGLKKPVALTRAASHAVNAKENYWSNRTYAMQELGRAIHFLCDVNVPHHSANRIAVLSNHTQYEKWADDRRTAYSASSSDLYSLLNPSDFNSEWETYVGDVVKDSARFSKAYIDLATSKSDNKYADWDEATQATIPHAQKITAAFLYNFLIAVGEI